MQFLLTQEIILVHQVILVCLEVFFFFFFLFYIFFLFTDPISVVVHVIKSEHRAAMQHENSSGNKFQISLSFTLIYFIIGLSKGFR